MAVVLNSGLLLLLWRWLQPRLAEPLLGRWLLPLLALKVLACAIATYFIGGDPQYYLTWSRAFNQQLWAEPGAWLRTLAADEFHFGGLHLVFHGFSNTLFFIKLLSGVQLAANGSAFLTGLYCSLFCFVACWELVRAVARAWPATPAGAMLIGFLAWPSVVYWTSGITKECLLVGSGAAVVALVVGWLYGGRPVRLATLGLAILLAGLHFQMRFFFAGLLLAALSGLGLLRVAERLLGGLRRWLAVLLMAGWLLGGAWVLGEISPVFSLNKFTSRLLINYHTLQQKSAHGPHLEYPNLQPTGESLLQHTPQAVAAALSRPWPWEGSSPLYVAAGLENLLLLVLLLWAAAETVRGRPGRLPFAVVVALLAYCLLLAALLGLSTPNLGTLNRYRVALLPYLLWLALQHPGAARWLRRLGM
ncbi:hypothetical protein SAMN02746009_01607 [Hymenobacter psychrotolerans DSM 18569]|uniref:Glycosyltransferase RgtA/B/C/D-like domain-containing protein n=1 Tax=Hymenobacter psychrotolerans DSM 18569 TaxID=1121959 RepID=A0A1M6VH75_9BACT|nr:hypothetical protein SAMN02746009_01607 [Hymenobacter psychrotolerans DSM 18569]